MKRYLVVWLGATAALLALVATANAVVDPYGVFRLVDAPGFNAVKPKAELHGGMVKAYQVLRVRPRTLILGNSRAEVGLSPDHAAWPSADRPVFNLALPGTGPTTTLAYLQHAIASAGNAKIVRVVWGVDFPDFLTDTTILPASGPQRVEARLLVGPDGAPNRERPWQQLRDAGESLFTLSALFDSAQTLASQRDPYAPDLASNGFNPLREYVKVAKEEGYGNLFRQTDLDNTRAYARRPRSIVDASGTTSADLIALRRILAICRRNGIALTLVIYPIHAHLLEIIRATDHWPAFEDWKRALVRAVADEARDAGGTSVPVVDFSGFHRYATEPVPARGDLRSTMRWYWEPGHFKRELGDLMIDRILATPDAPQDFGVALDASNVERQLADLRVAEAAYRDRHAGEVAELERMAVELRPRSRMR